ncbi:MAG TPA: 4-hydroxythreonine-4-phosphate dehydrogenase PdxA, partial [Bacteroidetes bacterium]|nr:4-hydroxythreonine-4-phosphate dehydrogenase PdxA [Bacteroidota bacterium]
MSNNKIRVGITQGDINGIGYELIIKTLQDNRLYDTCVPVVYGSPKVAAYHRKAVNIQNFSFNNIRHAAEAHEKRPNMINVADDDIRVELGKATPAAGEAALAALQAAVKDLKACLIDVLVTAPISKYSIRFGEFSFPGHTEYLASEFGGETLMLMVSDVMRVGMATGHIPLHEVPGQITEDLILKKLRIMDLSMQRDFMIRKPRLAILGLNPHAGEEGILGQAEQKIIVPALKTAREENILAFGPYPADGFFGSGSYRNFDAILAMYHDQGLIPFKSLAFDTGVNFTAGLEVVRTSPAHGTAFDIAGENRASPDSFRHALY